MPHSPATPPRHAILATLKKAIPAILLLGFTSLSGPAAQAQMTVVFTETPSDLVVSYSGNWATFNATSDDTLNLAQTANSSVLSLAGSVDLASTTRLSGSFAWNFLSGGTVSGDSFGFITTVLYAPMNYVAGTNISGSLTFSGQDLAALGVTAGSSGSLTYTGGVSINWSAAVSAVPEPSSFATLCGLAALGLSMSRRRRPASSASTQEA